MSGRGRIATLGLGKARFVLTLALTALLAACAPTGPRGGGGERAASQPAGLKSITVVSSVDRPVLHSKLQAGGAGYKRWIWLANAYLTGLDSSETPRPMLAEEIPSVERMTWTLNPDGTMETIYKIRPSAKWHDGTPVVAKDFAFAWEVYVDPEFPAYDRLAENLISAIDTPDERTLLIKWKDVFIGADAIGGGSLEPLPRHLLEDLYRTNKAAFIDGKHWSAEFVGAGPFRVEQWVPSAGQFVLTAHDGFALGRPKIDRVNISVITNDNAVLAAILAGTIDVNFESMATEAALVLRDQWESRGEGRVGVAPGSQRHIMFQLRDLPAAQPALRDSRVRRALSLAIDREGLASIQPPGFTPAAYYMNMSPTDRVYPTVERTIPKDAYDPTAAGRLLDDAGYRAGPDGLRRNAAGDRFTMQFLTLAGPEEERIGAVIDENWRGVGLDSELSIVPAARNNDNQFRATFPGAHIRSSAPNWTSDTILNYSIARIPHEGNRWTGSNLGGYSSPEADRLGSSILKTLDVRERDRLALQLVRLWAEDAAVLPFLFKSATFVAAKGIGGYDVNGSASAWSIYNWIKE